MKMLLMDDDFERINEINHICEKYRIQVSNAFNLDMARKCLQDENYDIFIIDLYIPANYDKKEILKDGGLIILNEVFNKNNLIRPTNIIIISDHLQEIKYKNDISKLPVSMISTNGSYNWTESLENLLDAICIRQVDIAIITATNTEFKAIFNNEWEKDIVIGGLTFYKRFFTHTNATAILVQAENMGMISASYLMSIMVKYYDPQKVIMIGVIAGNPKDTKLGDLIIADRAFDYSSGAIKEDENENPIFESDPISVEANVSLINIFRNYESSGIFKMIKDKVNCLFAEEKDNLIKKDCELASIQVGYVVTGPSVVKSKKYRELFIEKYYRKYLGLDMETFPVYYFCKKNGISDFLSIKSVCDNADKEKTSVYQPYCAKLVAEVLYYYIENDITM